MLFRLRKQLSRSAALIWALVAAVAFSPALSLAMTTHALADTGHHHADTAHHAHGHSHAIGPDGEANDHDHAGIPGGDGQHDAVSVGCCSLGFHAAWVMPSAIELPALAILAAPVRTEMRAPAGVAPNPLRRPPRSLPVT